MSDHDALVGQVILGEHEVLSVARASAALIVLSCRSTLDQRDYTVALAPHVTVGTSSAALSSAVERASRHAIGERNLLPLLAARVATLDDAPRIAVVRRGEAWPSVATWLDRAWTPADVARLLGPVGQALTSLHDQGMVHGAVSLDTVVVRDGALALDFFGLSQVAEAADGARGAAAIFPAPACPPEIEEGSLPGPWSDVHGLATIAVALLSGRVPPAPRSESIADIAKVGPRLEDALRLALARSPSPRPTVEVFLRSLSAADAPQAARASAPQREPAPSPERGDAPRAKVPEMRRPIVAPPTSDGARLAWTVAAVLGVFAMALGGALGWVVLANKAPGPAASASTAAAPPPLPPTASAVAHAPPDPSPPSGLSATFRLGNPTYPADHDALVPVEGDAVVRGDRDAFVTMVVFGDLTCPFTARLLTQLPALEARFGAGLRVVWKNHPSPSSPDATNALEAALVVRDKKGDVAFWRFVDAVTAGGADVGRLEELGIKAGLDAGAVTRAITARPMRAKIDRDVDLARRLGVRGTPVIFLNGRRLDGTWGHDVLEPLIETEIGRARSMLSSVSRDKLYGARVTANITTVEGER